MKPVRLFLCGFVSMALLGCGATVARRSFKESVRDGMIKTAVRYKLSKDKTVKARHMEIDVWRGVVTLHGRTLTADERARAEGLARGTKHVVAVENYLKLMNEPAAPIARTLPPSPTRTAAAPVVTATSAGMVANSTVPTPKPPQPTPTISTVRPTKALKATLAAVQPKAPGDAPKTAAPKTVAPKSTSVAAATASTSPTTPSSAPTASVTSIGAPTTATPRSAMKGKTLPWLGEVVDEEGPAMQPVKEIAERPRATVTTSVVSADEDLAREAAEELKRLRGSPPR